MRSTIQHQTLDEACIYPRFEIYSQYVHSFPLYFHAPHSHRFTLESAIPLYLRATLGAYDDGLRAVHLVVLRIAR